MRGNKRWLFFICLFMGIFICIPEVQAKGENIPMIPGEVVSETEAVHTLTDVRKSQKEEGKWKKKKGHIRFQKESGEWARNEWLKNQGKIYCFDEEGNARTGWYKYLDQKYYFDSDGSMYTGWKRIQNATFFFRKNGTLITNEWKKSKGKYYYLKEKGRMAKGWLTIGKKKYYMDENGARVTGDYFIGDEGYHFSKKGVFQPKVKVERVNPKLPMMALTFDDGPGPYTDRILNCLKKYRAKATFFVVGSSVENYADTVKKAAKMGCEIGNHTWNHPQLPTLDENGIISQISLTDQAVYKVTGKNTTVFRPTYGAYNQTVLSVAGKPIILWSVDTLDWKTRNVQSTVQSILNTAKDGSIVLMHDIHYPTAEAAEIVIPELVRRGYQLVTVSELIKYKGKALENGAIYREVP